MHYSFSTAELNSPSLTRTALGPNHARPLLCRGLAYSHWVESLLRLLKSGLNKIVIICHFLLWDFMVNGLLSLSCRPWTNKKWMPHPFYKRASLQWVHCIPQAWPKGSPASFRRMSLMTEVYCCYQTLKTGQHLHRLRMQDYSEGWVFCSF